MSRGLSWRQRLMLHSLAQQATRRGKSHRDDPIAWRSIDYRPTTAEADDFFEAMAKRDELSPRERWNDEKSVRRSLRSLERRGLVRLSRRHCFLPAAEQFGLRLEIAWSSVHPDDYAPGVGRIMTGVSLTRAGLAVAASYAAEIEATGQATLPLSSPAA